MLPLFDKNCFISITLALQSRLGRGKDVYHTQADSNGADTCRHLDSVVS
jgi:hypothetical protein